MDVTDHSFFICPSLSMNEISILLGLSIGRPKILAHTPLERHPRARETPKTTV
jgi:hypothetical protein